MSKRKQNFKYPCQDGSIVYHREYRQDVRDWIRDLRRDDENTQHRQRIRDEQRGDFDTAGRSGCAPGMPLAVVGARFTTDNGKDPFTE